MKSQGVPEGKNPLNPKKPKKPRKPRYLVYLPFIEKAPPLKILETLYEGFELFLETIIFSLYKKIKAVSLWTKPNCGKYRQEERN